MDSNTAGRVDKRIRYVFRRPRFPLIWAVGSEVFSATSPAVFQRQIRRLDLPGVIDMVDATGEGWAFHSEYIARRSVGRIIAEVAALAAYAQPNKTPQRTGARVARLGP